jgi:hypothetical protein
MAAPKSNLLYTSGGSLQSDGSYPAGLLGYNLADVSSIAQLDALPTGVLGLAYLDMTNGVDAAFMQAVDQYIGDARLWHLSGGRTRSHRGLGSKPEGRVRLHPRASAWGEDVHHLAQHRLG